MNFGEVPRYTVGEIERLAISFLREKCKPAVSIPIDIDYLIESEPGITLDYMQRLRDRFNTAGLVWRVSEGCFIVYIDETIANENPNFYRFTAAEELAHLKLHRKILEGITSIELAVKLLEWDGYWELDRNAKRFAAALLMPSYLVAQDARDKYRLIVNEVGFGDAEAIKRYVAELLSREYQVSSEAMSYRLNEWPIKIMEKIDEAVREQLNFLPD
ncbi:MAG: hypothetical protein A3E19_06295 [Planctomycetes bacterium RIFCSPHIGHO2_12_FULL_52_36]|nr:MAG: hypothetical protein A3E19_06295 [Planctomycetes bacterium RIFCSPHIGHO2_12_FULL_52_36]